MTPGRAHHSSTGPRLRPSIAIGVVDRFSAPREAVVGWNPDSAGFEAAISVFVAGQGPVSGPGAGFSRHDSWILGSSPPSTVPTVMVVGRETGGDESLVLAGRDPIGPVVDPARRSLCLTVDSLLDAMRFEGFRFDAAGTERISELADHSERVNGPAMLCGRRWEAATGSWIRLGLEHPSLPASRTVFRGRWCGPLGMLEVARCILELCWTRRWTPGERDLALTLALDVLADPRGEFRFSATDIAHWCLSGRSPSGRVAASPRSGSSLAPSQLHLPL